MYLADNALRVLHTRVVTKFGGYTVSKSAW
jgi:hypothetical protein